MHYFSCSCLKGLSLVNFLAVANQVSGILPPNPVEIVPNTRIILLDFAHVTTHTDLFTSVL